MHSDHLPDIEDRLVAQTVFHRPVVLEAGAGTGKTAALVARIVAWSLGPGWDRALSGFDAAEIDDDRIAAAVLNGVVAITFTEDAAAEMARRVVQAFDEIHRSDASADGRDWPEGKTIVTGLYRQALPEDIGVVKSRAAALLTEVEWLRISTIHAFARALLARFPVEAGVHPSFEVDADGTATDDCVEWAVEELLSGAYRGEQLGDAALLLAGRGVGPVEIRDVVAVLVGDGCPAEALSEDPMGPQQLAPIVSRLFESLDTFAPAALRMTQVKGSRTVATAQWLLDLADRDRPGEGESPETTLAGIAQWIRDQPEGEQNIGRLNLWGHKYDYSQAEEEFFESVSDAEFDAICRLAEVMQFIPTFDPEVFGALRRILQEVLSRVENEKRRAGIVGFQDLLVKARCLLENSLAVLQTLRGEIAQLLVDEMQDTDSDQATIISLLGMPDEHGVGPGLFLVGDPKQSIYGWRNADMKVYQKLVRDIKDQGGDVRSLRVNFRSLQPVLDEVTRLVEPVMEEKEDLQPAFERLIAAKGAGDGLGCEEGPRTAVEHWVSTAAGLTGVPEKTSAPAAAELEAEAVARDVAALKASGTPWPEMAILMRSRGQQAIYLEALRRYGVPYVVGKDANYYRTREVIEVMAFVRLILDPFDTLALVAVLRSPMVGVPDAALRPLWKAGLPGRLMRLARTSHRFSSRERRDGTQRGFLSNEATSRTRQYVAGDELRKGPRGVPYLRSQQITGEKSGLGAEESPEGLRILIGAAAREVEGLDLGGVSLVPLAGWPEALQGFLTRLLVLRESFEVDAPDIFLENLRSLMALEPLAACRFPGAYRLANLDRFFRDLEQVLHESGTADTILRRLRRTERENPDETSGRPRSDVEGIAVLTIHGAKGLGFEHVWLVQTHAGPGPKNRGTVTGARWINGRWEMVIRGLRTPGYFEVEAEHKNVEEAERLRLLYVALTRAKKRLVTVGNWMPTTAMGPMLKSFENRDGGWPTIGDLWPDEAQGPHRDIAEALWVWLGHPRWDAETPRVEALKVASATIDPARIMNDAEQLDRWIEEAQEHQYRPWLGTASEEAHRLFREAMADRLEGAEDEAETSRVGGAGERVAMAVGTAMHGLLERFDHGAEDSIVEMNTRLDEALVWLDGVLLREDIRVTAGERLEALVKIFREGPLWHRFLALEGSILARELALVVTPDAGAAVGAVTGAIDLVYRDPDTDEIVVADYKTDRLADDAEIQDRAGVYQPQLEIYARAFQEAMNLDVTPRQELWFVGSGVVIGVEWSK
ncbi:MAG: UvrD-helicase domain-containing protein [Thermoanaerobaculales bacterium]|nr:UvrD-helicase domain-containing protein [Thermoanaerobaculales bacterium]